MTVPRVLIDTLCNDGLVSIQTGPFGSQLHAHEYVEEGVPVVPTEAIRDRRINRDVLPKIAPETAQRLSRHRLELHDILFARRGVQATGHSAIVAEGDVGSICGTGAIRLRVANDQHHLNPEYLSFYFASAESVSWLKNQAIGATMPNLNEGILRRLSVPLPGYATQYKIAEFLLSIEGKIELNRQMNETLEAMAQAIFRDWFVDFGPTRRKKEGATDPVAILGGLISQPENAAQLGDLFPSKLGDDGLPEGWEPTRIDQVMELAYGKSLTKKDRTDGDFPVYGSGGVNGTHNAALVKGPGVIVGRKGTVGSLYWEERDFYPIDTVFYVKPSVPLSFAYYLLQTLGLENMNTDAAVPGLNRNNVYRLDPPVGCEATRNAFADIVDVLRGKISQGNEENLTLATTRDLLLPKLMSGEIRLRDWEATA